jgi:hypothetical protein
MESRVFLVDVSQTMGADLEIAKKAILSITQQKIFQVNVPGEAACKLEPEIEPWIDGLGMTEGSDTFLSLSLFFLSVSFTSSERMDLPGRVRARVIQRCLFATSFACMQATLNLS